MKKLLGVLFVAATGLMGLNAQTTDEKTNLQLQEEELPVKKKKQVSDDGVDIWKFNALGTIFNGFNISYERKIAPNWSINLNSVTGFESVGKNYSAMVGSSWALHGFAWRNVNFHQSLALQMRYYHNLERRKRLGKSAGFSGNYFALEIKGGINGYNKNIYWWEQSNRGSSILSTVSLQYGIQRKIGKRSYIDGSIGMGIGHMKGDRFGEFYLLPTLKLGVGLTF